MTSTTLTHHWHLIVDNHEPHYRAVRELAALHRDARADLADALKEWTAEDIAQTAPVIYGRPDTLVSELMVTALDFIDWYGIATTLLAELAEEEGR